MGWEVAASINCIVRVPQQAERVIRMAPLLSDVAQPLLMVLIASRGPIGMSFHLTLSPRFTKRRLC